MPSSPRPIHITTGNYGFIDFNQTLYKKIDELHEAGPESIVIMNVGIHDMTRHTIESYQKIHPNLANFHDLEELFQQHVVQFLNYVVALEMQQRFVWVSGTPYDKTDTEWEEERKEKKRREEVGSSGVEEEMEAKVGSLLRANTPSSLSFPLEEVGVGRRSLASLSRFYRTFLFTKSLCDRLGIKFLDIYHPLSGPGFDNIAVKGDVHKKRYAWRMKASLLLLGLVQVQEQEQEEEDSSKEKSNSKQSSMNSKV